MQGKDDHLTVINGSYGEGGGRILRTFLALSAIHQKPVTLQHIRSNRSNPGLNPQPLKGLEALAHITGVKIEGGRNGSQTINFVSHKTGLGCFRSG
jgi:RNA 3'-terminal phosphate cyclase (ATP)